MEQPTPEPPTPISATDTSLLDLSQPDPTGVCPHCFQPVMIASLACGIFRHGWVKDVHGRSHPIPPHASMASILQMELFEGCGKPFQILVDPITHQWKIQKCGYV